MKTNKFWSIMMMLVVVLFSAISFTSCKDDDGESDIPKLTKLWQKTGTNIAMSIWDKMNGISNHSMQFVILDPTNLYGIAVGDPLNWSLEDNFLKIWQPQGTLDVYKMSVSENTLCLNDMNSKSYDFITSNGQPYTSSTNESWVYGRWRNLTNDDIFEFNSDRSGRLLDKNMQFKRIFFWGADNGRLAILYRDTSCYIDNMNSDLFKITTSTSNLIQMTNCETGEDITWSKF